jgi:hypothetical protein
VEGAPNSADRAVPLGRYWSWRPGVAPPGLCRLSAWEVFYVAVRTRARIAGVPWCQGAATPGCTAQHHQGTVGIPVRTLVFPYNPEVARLPLGPQDRTIQLGEAARRLGVTRSTLQGRVKAKDPSIRGLAPQSEFNPGNRWLVSLDDVDAELRAKGLLDRPLLDPSVDAMRVEMLQGALTEEKDRRITQLETMLATLRADKDARIAQLELQLETLGETLAAMTTRTATAAAP